MRVYKYTNSAYCKPWSFRLGTLYDYRREEELGSQIGDKSEGSHHLKYNSEFEISDEFMADLGKNQHFSFAWAKGENEGHHFCAITSSNLLVYSAVEHRDDELYNSFAESNCCVAINDFELFAINIISNIRLPIINWKIARCTYGPKNWVDTLGPIPSIAFAKDEAYKHQSEVRLCIEVAADVVTPLIVNGNKFWKYCSIIHRR